MMSTKKKRGWKTGRGRERSRLCHLSPLVSAVASRMEGAPRLPLLHLALFLESPRSPGRRQILCLNCTRGAAAARR